MIKVSRRDLNLFIIIAKEERRRENEKERAKEDT